MLSAIKHNVISAAEGEILHLCLDVARINKMHEINEDKTKNTLVTGASGFIGKRLRCTGEIALARKPEITTQKMGLTRAGDLLDVASLMHACEGIGTIFHCAGYAHAFKSPHPDLHWKVNFEGTRNLVQVAASAGVKHFVFLSSVKAMAEPGDACVDENYLGEPITAYGRAKRAAEDIVLEVGAKSGMHVVNLRLAMVYGRGGRGNLERMAGGISAGWFPSVPETHNRRSLVHVDDVVAALRCVAHDVRANGKTYIIADAKTYSGHEIYQTLRDALGLSQRRWSVPASCLRGGAKIGDLLSGILCCPFPLQSEVVSRLLDSACYSPALIERELGWRAKIQLRQGLAEMLGAPQEESLAV